jgi:hypothetical protein
MRKLLISVAAAGAALVVASPASAQYYGGQPYGYGYGQAYSGYGQAYSGYGQAYSGYGQTYGYSNSAYRDYYRERARQESRRRHHRWDRAERYDRGRDGYGYNGYYGRDRDRDRDDDGDRD